MKLKTQLSTVLLMACAALAMVCGIARADEIPLVTGEHWTKSSDQVKKAYLVGIANVLQVETAFEGANPPPDAQSLVPRLARGSRAKRWTP